MLKKAAVLQKKKHFVAEAWKAVLLRRNLHHAYRQQTYNGQTYNELAVNTGSSHVHSVYGALVRTACAHAQ